MKRIQKILLSLIIIQFISCTNSQSDKEQNEKSIESQQELKIVVDKLDIHIGKQLFEKAKLNEFEEIVWIAKENEKLEFPISDDKKCHTLIDTVFYFTSNNNDKSAVVIFRTYQFDKYHKRYGSHYQGTPISVAIFKENRIKKWELVKFKKKLVDLGYFVGSDSQYEGIIEFKKLNSNLNCLYIKQNPGGQQGYVEGFESIYNLDENVGRDVLSILYYNDYSLTNYNLLKLN